MGQKTKSSNRKTKGIQRTTLASRQMPLNAVEKGNTDFSTVTSFKKQKNDQKKIKNKNAVKILSLEINPRTNHIKTTNHRKKHGSKNCSSSLLQTSCKPTSALTGCPERLCPITCLHDERDASISPFHCLKN